MAETRKITIEILGGSDSSSGTTANKKSGDSVDKDLTNTIQTMMHPIASAENATLGKTVIFNQIYQNAKQLTLNAIDLTINRNITLKEDYIAETTYNNAKSFLSKATGFASAVGGGALTGAQLGLPGAAVGAIIGFGTFVGSEMLSNRAQRSAIYQDLNANILNTNFNRVRAGLVNEGRGTEN